MGPDVPERNDALTRTVHINITEKYFKELQDIGVRQGKMFRDVCRSCLYDGIDINSEPTAGTTQVDPHDELRKTMPEGLVKGDSFPDYDDLGTSDPDKNETEPNFEFYEEPEEEKPNAVPEDEK